MPVCFVEVGDAEVSEGDSKTNPGQARRLAEVVNGVLSAGELSPSDLGVVTPYQAQVRLLRRTLRDIHTAPHGHDMSRLDIASVDAFQGSEKELIVFSAVRSNAEGSIGFLNDWRRLNVMLTRAKRGLIVIGNAGTLHSDKFWKRWLQWCHERNCIEGGGNLTLSTAGLVTASGGRGAAWPSQTASAMPQAHTMGGYQVNWQAAHTWQTHGMAAAQGMSGMSSELGHISWARQQRGTAATSQTHGVAMGPGKGGFQHGQASGKSALQQWELGSCSNATLW